MLNVLSDEMGQLNGTKPEPQGLWHAEADAVVKRLGLWVGRNNSSAGHIVKGMDVL